MATIGKIFNRRLVITYPGNIENQEEYKQWFVNIKEPKELYLINQVLQNGTKVCNVLIDFGEPYRSRAQRRFDYQNMHPEVTKVFKSEREWENFKIQLGLQRAPEVKALSTEKIRELANTQSTIPYLQIYEQEYRKAVRQMIKKDIQKNPEKYRSILVQAQEEQVN